MFNHINVGPIYNWTYDLIITMAADLSVDVLPVEDIMLFRLADVFIWGAFVLDKLMIINK